MYECMIGWWYENGRVVQELFFLAGKGRRRDWHNSQDQDRARVPSTAVAAAPAAGLARARWQQQPSEAAADGDGRKHGAAAEETDGAEVRVLGVGRRQDQAGAARQTSPGTATPAAGQGQAKEFQGYLDTSLNH